MKEMVTVKITISERETYTALVEMSKEEFERLEKELDEKSGKELRELEETIGRHCHRINDWQDSDDFQLEEFGIEE